MKTIISNILTWTLFIQSKLYLLLCLLFVERGVLSCPVVAEHSLLSFLLTVGKKLQCSFSVCYKWWLDFCACVMSWGIEKEKLELRWSINPCKSNWQLFWQLINYFSFLKNGFSFSNMRICLITQTWAEWKVQCEGFRGTYWQKWNVIIKN